MKKQFFYLIISWMISGQATGQRLSFGDLGLYNLNILTDSSFYYSMGFSSKISYRIYPSDEKLYDKNFQVYLDAKPFADIISSNQMLGGITGIRIRYVFGQNGTSIPLFGYTSPRMGWSLYYRNAFLYAKAMNNFKSDFILKGFNYHEIGYTSDEFILTFNIGLYYMHQADAEVFGISFGVAETF